MKITVTLPLFRDAFIQANRKTNFSYDGLAILFEFLIDSEESTDADMELDVIAFCCDYVEMTLEEAADAYSVEVDDVMDFLEYHTYIIGSTNKTILFVQF